MRQFWLGCILLSTAVSGWAVTLGRHSGVALIGRPLDIRAQVLLASGEDPAALCLSADVLYGDSQVGGVRTQVIQSASGADVFLRIQTSQPVNEPVVTVFVRAGCQAPFTRRYVLLADPESEPAPATASAPSPVPGLLPLVPSPGSPTAGSGDGPMSSVTVGEGERAEGSPGVSTARAAGATPAPRPAPRVTTPRPTAAAAPSVVRRPVPSAPAPAGPRLQLDPVDLSLPIDRDPVLRLSMALLSEPATSEEARQAAGLLWKALNASPEELMRDAQKMAVLEAEAQGLRQEEARNQALIAELQAQLDEAGQRNWLLYGLGLLLLLSLLALAVVMRKRRTEARDTARSKAWWNEEVAQRPLTAAPAAPAAAASDVDIDIDLAAAPDFQGSSTSLSPLSEPGSLDAEARAAGQKGGQRDFAPSALGVSRSMATEELFDVQQQADFFISLGEDDQAIQILRNHLAESQEPSPLAFLDLLSLYHRLGRRDDYEALRNRFNEVCNAGAPRFDQYSDRGLGLEGYETAMDRIQALWPQPRVLDVIEKSIFRDPNDVDGEVFDLEAYRELLLLHALAKEIIRKEVVEASRGEPPRSGFSHTKIQPLRAAGAVAGGLGAPTQPQDVPPASPNLGLDVDLDELAELSAFEASLPDVSVKVEPTARTGGAGSQSDPMIPSNLIDFEVLDFLHSTRHEGGARTGEADPNEEPAGDQGKGQDRS